ncbi:dsDNA nuclease domain-containing protein [Rudaeicoccus suwonensis]|uniref:Uncharacterized protein DUF4297 n=1 Tax=Rudaeicoccus suwonensis TaxID=657409 RepID=A0A561EC41_9MICO|nr:dsDNA nuclease domain-containing protein [Rudaeicoccus suwonensis]TWE13174.1 uncharacterized protein DUF4297 [Rudaeicoccus suwonensis]
MSTDEAASGVEEASGPQVPENLAAFTGLASDPTGIDTFERYVWQAKLAIRSWLGVLAESGVLAVVCEHVEDLAIVETSGYRFAQLKTRDKGSWSAARICESGHAIEKLVASYKLAEEAGILSQSRFEVWLEGPPSEQKATSDFFSNPSSASDDIKKKIRAFGLAGAKLTDFLQRLSIHCQQPARPTVDAVIIRLIGAIWPGQSMQQVERLYESLLQAAVAAQSSSATPQSVRAAMQSARSVPADPDVWGEIAAQTLSAHQLRALCPPLAADTDQDLLARAAAGEASVLELKLIRAGASEETVKSALLARAEANVAATGARASGAMTAENEVALDTRLLAAAGSIASLAESNGLTIQRPAEQIFHTLMSGVANTAALDVDGLYNRDHRLVIGHLCGVSDQCRFAWGVS